MPQISDYYSDADLKKLLNIVSLLKKGLKISDFKDKGEKEIAEIVRKTTHRMPGVEAFYCGNVEF